MIDVNSMYPSSCWLATNGEITVCGFGEHGAIACEIIQDHPVLYSEYNKWCGDSFSKSDPVDFLMEEAGYCRYLNWGGNIPAVWITPPKRRPTRAQIHKMYLYSSYIYTGS